MMISLWGTISVIFFTSIMLFLLLHLSNKTKTFHWDIRFLVLLFIVMVIRLVVPLEIHLFDTFYSKNLLVTINDFFNISLFSSVSILQFLICVWIIGSIFKLYGFIRKTYLTYKVFKSYSSIKVNEHMLKKLILENPKLNMNNIRIISSSLVSAPMVYGFFRGVIIIPKQDFSDEELSFILQHEVYHFTHHHVWVKLVTELIYIIYWWNPILLFTRIRANELLEKEVDLNIIQNHNNKTTVEYTKFLLSMFEKQKLVSTVEQNSYGKTSLISEFININYTTVFYSRCKTILAYDKKQQRSTIIFLKYMIMGICIMIGSMVVIHPEYVPDEEGVFELTEEDSYLKPTSSGYDIYYNDEYLYSIDENLEGYEYLPIEE